MEKATISQIKNHLSRYLRQVRAGESVLILDRDQPVARLTAIDPAARPHDRLERLEREGSIRRALEAVPMDVLRSRPIEGRGGVLQALIAERREGR